MSRSLNETEWMSRLFVGVWICLIMVDFSMAANPCYHSKVQCVPINNTWCLTTKIDFNNTATLFTNDSIALEEVRVHLEVWSHLQRVPECWSIIQPFLCSVYLPQCDPVVGVVEKPNRELCERVKGPCEIVTRFNGSWPWFLQCDQWFYAESCGQTVYETSNFDTTGSCVSPLINTEDKSNWYDMMKGCGIQCEDPLYTTQEHQIAFIFVAVVASLSIISSLFTLVTFILDWKVGSKYPAVILFYINGCLFVAKVGWMMQFFIPDGVVCRKDGTIRTAEPLIGAGETASCTIVFILVYYFTMAAVIWFVMLGYAWDIHFKAVGTVRDDLSKKTAYFHIISWCLPLVLTIICLSTSVIDADALSGICFPGFTNIWVRVGYIIAPIVIALAVGATFSSRGLQTLRKVKKDSPPFVGQRATAKLHGTIIRLGVFIIIAITLVLISLFIHIYAFSNKTKWENSLEDYTYCQANVSVVQILSNDVPSSCEMESRPSIVAALVHMFAFFGTSLAFSSWLWTKASIDVWRRTWRRLLKKPVNEPKKLHKHRLSSRTSKRQKRRSKERLSISYGTDQDDPVGMRFDRSSMSSHSRSSGFAISMSKHGRRLRGVLPSHLRRANRRQRDADNVSNGSQRSRSSNRQSYESSMSQKLSDVERELREEERRRRRKRKKKRRQNRVQPILEPISSNLAAIRMRQLERQQRRRSDSSDHSRASAHGVNLALDKNNPPLQSLGSSNILSESAVTEDGNSISEIELPLVKAKVPDFSMFTVNTALANGETKEDNSNATNTTNLKGANPSPSGSVRRGRRREVKLEMTETSFYQEDDENIEMGGNQTIHAEENCHEVAEVKGNLKDIGPLVNEIFEHARAGQSNGRNNRPRDVTGSSRLGSASSRGSRSSRGSQSASKDLKYANTKVNLPPEGPRTDNERTARKRPFSGDYILTSRRNTGKRDEATRKSQSQPGSRVSSATSNHKRQIGHNGKKDFSEGLSWSRFLQTKGYNAGNMFGPLGMTQHADKAQMDFLNSPLFQESGQYQQPQFMGQGHYQGYNLGQFQGQTGNLQGPFSKHLQADPLHDPNDVQQPPRIQSDSPINRNVPEPNPASPVDILNVEQEHRKYCEVKRPYTNPYRKRRDPTEGDVLANEPDEVDDDDTQNVESEPKSTSALNILNVEEEHFRNFSPNGQGTVNVLNVAAEQALDTDSEFGDPDRNQTVVNVDVYDKVKDIDEPHIVIHATKGEVDKSYEKIGIANGTLELENDNSNQRNKAPSPVYATPVKTTKKESEITKAEDAIPETKTPRITSPFENLKDRMKDQKHLKATRNQGAFLDGHKISAFDGQSPQKTKKVPQAKFIIPDMNKLNGAVVMSKPVSSDSNYVSDQNSVSSPRNNDNTPKTNTTTQASKPITIGRNHNAKGKSEMNAKVNPKLETKPNSKAKLDAKPPSAETSAKNILPHPPRNRLGSDGFGSSGSRSLSGVTRSSGTSHNSGNSQNSSKKSDSGLGALNLEFINDHIKGKEKAKGGSKVKTVPDRSVGMFDFVEDDRSNPESDYDDVSTDNLTDTYTYTDYDDDLTEVSSLPC